MRVARSPGVEGWRRVGWMGLELVKRSVMGFPLPRAHGSIEDGWSPSLRSSGQAGTWPEANKVQSKHSDFVSNARTVPRRDKATRRGLLRWSLCSARPIGVGVRDGAGYRASGLRVRARLIA